MRRFFTQQIWLLTLLLLGTSQAGQAAVSQFEQSEINSDRFLTVAAPAGRSGYQLLILEQVKDSRPCWNESGSNPTIVEPLLLQFDFTGICSRSTDSNGYSLRTAGEDQGLRYSLRVMKQQNDLILVAASNTVRNLEIPIGRSYGLPAPGEFVQIKLDPGWRLTRRTFNGRTTGHVYLTNDQPISYLVALAGSTSGTVPPSPSQQIPTPNGAGSPSQPPGAAQPNTGIPIPVPLPNAPQAGSPQPGNTTQSVPPQTTSSGSTTTGIPIPVPLPDSPQSGSSTTRPGAPTTPPPNRASTGTGTTSSPQSTPSTSGTSLPLPRQSTSSPQSTPSTSGTSLPLPRQSNTTPPPPPPPPTTPSDRPVPVPLNPTPATGSTSQAAPSASSSPGRTLPTLPALPSPSAPANPSSNSSTSSAANSSTSSPTIVPTVPATGSTSQSAPPANSSSGRTLPALPPLPSQSTPASPSSNSSTSSATNSSTSSAANSSTSSPTIVPTVPATGSTSQSAPSANSSSGRTLPALPPLPRQSTPSSPSGNSSTNSSTVVPTAPAPTNSSTASTPTTTVPTLPATPGSARPTETAAAPSQTAPRSSGYRVIVEANTAELQDQVRSVVPQAQIVTVNGQVVMQAGLFRDLSSAEQLRQKLVQSNLSATVVPIR